MKGVFMKPIVEFRCLMNTKFKPNIQNGIARCDKTLNEYVIKNGNNNLLIEYFLTNNRLKLLKIAQKPQNNCKK